MNFYVYAVGWEPAYQGSHDSPSDAALVAVKEWTEKNCRERPYCRSVPSHLEVFVSESVLPLTGKDHGEVFRFLVQIHAAYTCEIKE